MNFFNFLKKKPKAKEVTEEPEDFGKQLEAAEKLKQDLEEEATEKKEEVMEEDPQVNLKDLGDFLPDKVINAKEEDLYCLLYRLDDVNGKVKWNQIELPNNGRGIFPVGLDLLKMTALTTGPGKFYFRVWNKKSDLSVYNTPLPFSEDIKTQKETDKEEANAIDRLRSDMTEKFDNIVEMIKTKGGLTFEQQLIMKFLTEAKKGGSEINESLMTAFAGVKTQEIKSGAEIKKTEISSHTELSKMKLEIEKAKIGIAATLDELPDEFKTKEEAEEGLGKVVNGLNKFVEGMSNFMNNLSNVIEKAQTPGEQEKTEDDIDARAEKIAGETMGEDK